MLLAFAGCGHVSPGMYDEPDYGILPPPSHPTVILTDFSYTPASPIHINDTLTLTAKTNLPVADAQVRVHFPDTLEGPLELTDDGRPPDALAGDGIWTGEQTWTAEMGTADESSIWVTLDFDGYYNSQMLTDSVTVLPEEER
jgi:hypothetical protein